MGEGGRNKGNPPSAALGTKGITAADFVVMKPDFQDAEIPQIHPTALQSGPKSTIYWYGNPVPTQNHLMKNFYLPKIPPAAT